MQSCAVHTLRHASRFAQGSVGQAASQRSGQWQRALLRQARLYVPLYSVMMGELRRARC